MTTEEATTTEEVSTTEEATTTEEVSTTEGVTTTDESTTTTTLLRESSVVVVVANASDTFGLATLSADRIRDFGYVFVIRSDGLQELENTAIYFAEGFQGEARRLAGQIGVPLRLVDPLPEGPLYEGDIDAEVVVMLGNDWPDVTNLDS